MVGFGFVLPANYMAKTHPGRVLVLCYQKFTLFLPSFAASGVPFRRII
jgi:hypothetical protein